MSLSLKKLALVALLPAGFTTAFPSIGRLSRRQQNLTETLTEQEDILINAVNNDSIADTSFYHTHGLHLGGTNRSQAEWTADRWSEAGWTSDLAIYNVFLNYPLDNNMNLTYANGTVWQPVLEEDVLEEDPVTGWPDRVPTFHAYSASGTAEAEYVYVGLGQIDDFQRLIDGGIEVEGKIALSRYGGPFRGIKVQNAQAFGCVGIVLFNDLADDGEVKVANGYEAYPDGPARNPSYVQRGSVMYLSNQVGDPTTPGYPSRADSPRADRFETVPRIPSLPISYANAGPLIQALEGYGLSGEEVNRTNWVGDHDAGYWSGPAPNVTINMSNLMNDTYTDIWNTIGIINGTNADETIIVGNHRDAWMIGGAGDPNSGSACLTEFARAIGELLETGWQPRRNIVIASWDAEEYGLVGSTEWVEEYIPWLSGTAIAYVNIDSATTGPIPYLDATPELHQVGIEAMKKVAWPASNGTIYDAWIANTDGEEVVGVLGSGSDYTPFVQSGIASIDMYSRGGPTDAIWMYHSNYDTYEWMINWGDAEFQQHKAMTQWLALIVYHLADDSALPLNASNYAAEMETYYAELREVIDAGSEDVDTSALAEAIESFATHAAEAEALMQQAIDDSNDELVELINHKYRDFQRLFVATPGLPTRQFYRHAIFCPGRDTGYAPVTFPGITESITFDGDYELAREWVEITAGVIERAGLVLAT